jgi:hypothetical protein
MAGDAAVVDGLTPDRMRRRCAGHPRHGTRGRTEDYPDSRREQGSPGVMCTCPAPGAWLPWPGLITS